VPKNKKSPGKKTNQEQESLAKELRALIPKLDTEGLDFLVKQAKIHLYNMKVDELNETARSINSGESKSVSKTKKPSKTEVLTIDATGAGYYMRYNNDGVIFSKNEMTRVVKIVNAPGAEAEIASRLYNWFRQERIDIFNTIPISNKSDNLLISIVRFIKKNFKLKT
jgi:hypothetical protein